MNDPVPGREEFVRLAREGNLIPVYREFLADMETPVSALAKLQATGPSFLLESVEGGERIGRYSFLGADPAVLLRSRGREVILVDHGETRTFQTATDPLDELDKLMQRYRPVRHGGLPRFYGGAVGYMGYDMVKFLETIEDSSVDDLAMPDLYFMVTDSVLIFDRVDHTVKVVANAYVDGDAGEAWDAAVAKIDGILETLSRPVGVRWTPTGGKRAEPALSSNIPRERFLDMVQAAREYILAGDAIQVVLSQRFETPVKCSALDLHRALRSVNPSPYMFCLQFPELSVVGSSPEVHVRCEEGDVEVRPIAGTRPRGGDPGEDLRLERELLADEKERAEHIMLVDLARNDIGRVCRYGSVTVPELMVVERYSHVMHIVSDVVGRLAPGNTVYDVMRATFPAGTVSGAPKIRAMEIIGELEPTRRGPYAGAVGYFSFSGNLDSCITIRTIVLHEGTAYVQAGAGIVADSAPDREFEETVNKARGMVQAIGLAEQFAGDTQGRRQA